MPRKSRRPRGPISWELLGRAHGALAAESVAAFSSSNARDVTDADNERLGAFVKQTALGGYTCVIYPQNNRVMLRVE